MMVTEIIIYKLKESMKDVYWNAFKYQSLPMMRKWNIKVIDYGFSIDDEFTFYLIRSFDSLDTRNKILDEFYNSDDWKLGARKNIIDAIASDKTIVYRDKKTSKYNK